MSSRARAAGLRPDKLSYKPRTQPARAAGPKAPRRILLFSRESIGRLIGGASGGALLFYVSYVTYSINRDARRVAEEDVPADTSDRYNRNASYFDADVAFLESITGVNKRRAQLCKLARGHVLESSVGTGRNMEYLPLVRRGIKSVTMVDKSREMVDVARHKWPEAGNAFFIHAKFRVQDLTHEKVPCPKSEGFDTVLQTMGLCSTGEPEKLLRNLGEMTDPEHGQILLLEHGRGKYWWVNSFLDYTAKAHADRHGCWYNKDIGDIVRRSGLEIVEEKRFDLGTTWWYVLRPAKKTIQVTTPASPSYEGSSWLSWLR